MTPTIHDAIAAGDGTLHGAIDYWQARTRELEAERDALRASLAQVINAIETYRVPVGNSAAGELAAEWTMDALRELHASALAARGE